MSEERRDININRVYEDVIELVKSKTGSSIPFTITVVGGVPIGLLAARRSRVWSAIMLGLRSRIHRRAATPSVRTDVVDKIRAAVSSREAKGFIAVLGETGVGKTTAIASATERFAICC